MKKMITLVAICSLIFGIPGKAGENIESYLQKQLNQSRKNRLKTQLNDTYPKHVEQFAWDNSWIQWQTIDIQYNQHGLPTEITTRLGEGEEALVSREVFTYNSLMYEIENLKQYYDTEIGGWVNQNRKRSKFEERDQVEFISENWMEDHWEINNGFQWEYKMDGLARTTEIVTKELLPETGIYENRTRQRYTYPSTGVHYSIEQIDIWNGSGWVTWERWDYTWISDLHWEYLAYTYDNSQEPVQVTLDRKVINYWEDLNVIITSYKSVGDDFYADDRFSHLVDDHGNPVLYKSEKGNGEKEGWTLMYGTEYDLTYDGNNVVQRITKVYNPDSGQDWAYELKEIFSDFFTVSSGIPATPEQKISLFPNPAINQATVHLENAGTESVFLSVFSLNGQKLFEQIHAITGRNDFIILGISDLAPGMYVLSVKDLQGRDIGKSILIRE